MKLRRVSDRSVRAIIKRIGMDIKKSDNDPETYADFGSRLKGIEERPLYVKVPAGLNLAQLDFICKEVYRAYHPWIVEFFDISQDGAILKAYDSCGISFV